jgi:hypothetical protein
MIIELIISSAAKRPIKIHGLALLSVVYWYGDEIIETKLGWYF